MASFNKVSEQLTKRFPFYQTGVGAEIAKVLNRLTDPADRSNWYNDIERAIRATDVIARDRRVIHSKKDPDPLTNIRILSEIGADKPTILASIYITRLFLMKPNPYAAPEPDQMEQIITALEKIGGRPAREASAGRVAQKRVKPAFDEGLSKEVEALVRNTLQISEINRGGVATDGSQSAEEQHATFLHMVMEAVKDPRAPKIRGANFLSHMREVTNQYMENPTAENRQAILKANDDAKNIYIPLVSAYGHAGLRDKIRDAQFWMMNPERHQEVSDKIISLAKDMAEPGKAPFVTNIDSALRIVIPRLEENIVDVLPAELRSQVRIVGDIKKPVSTDQKLNKKGIAHDIVRLRIEVTAAGLDGLIANDDWTARGNKEDVSVFTAEGAACNQVLKYIHGAANEGGWLSHSPDEIRFREKAREMRDEARKTDSKKRASDEDVVWAIQQEDTANAVRAEFDKMTKEAAAENRKAPTLQEAAGALRQKEVEKVIGEKFDKLSTDRKAANLPLPTRDDAAEAVRQEQIAKRAAKFEEMRKKNAKLGQKSPTDEQVDRALAMETAEYQRSFTNYYKDPKENGYRAIHIHLVRNVEYEREEKDLATGEMKKVTEIRATRFELQIVGVLTHNNNKVGTAGHDEKYKKLATRPNSTAAHTVTTFTSNNAMHTGSRGITAIDVTVMQDKNNGLDNALSCNDMVVKRHPSNWFDRDIYPTKESFKNEDPRLSRELGTVVRTGDTVAPMTAPELLGDAKHMDFIIQAANDPQTREKLRHRKDQLLHNLHGPQTDRPNGSPRNGFGNNGLN